MIRCRRSRISRRRSNDWNRRSGSIGGSTGSRGRGRGSFMASTPPFRQGGQRFNRTRRRGAAIADQAADSPPTLPAPAGTSASSGQGSLRRPPIACDPCASPPASADETPHQTGRGAGPPASQPWRSWFACVALGSAGSHPPGRPEHHPPALRPTRPALAGPSSWPGCRSAR